MHRTRDPARWDAFSALAVLAFTVAWLAFCLTARADPPCIFAATDPLPVSTPEPAIDPWDALEWLIRGYCPEAVLRRSVIADPPARVECLVWAAWGLYIDLLSGGDCRECLREYAIAAGSCGP